MKLGLRCKPLRGSAGERSYIKAARTGSTLDGSEQLSKTKRGSTSESDWAEAGSNKNRLVLSATDATRPIKANGKQKSKQTLVSANAAAPPKSSASDLLEPG